jgi:hypothetical protein
MRRKLLTTGLLLGCKAILLAQTGIGNESTVYGRVALPAGQISTSVSFSGILTNRINYPPVRAAGDYTSLPGGFHSAMIPMNRIDLDGSSIVSDAFIPPAIPEPASGIMLLVGSVLLASFSFRRTPRN